MKALLTRFLVSLLSTGWVLPAWLAASTFVEYWRVEAGPRLAGGDPLNSFPYLSFTHRCLSLACAWLALVIFFWAWRAARPALVSTRAAGES